MQATFALNVVQNLLHRFFRMFNVDISLENLFIKKFDNYILNNYV